MAKYAVRRLGMPSCTTEEYKAVLRQERLQRGDGLGQKNLKGKVAEKEVKSLFKAKK